MNKLKQTIVMRNDLNMRKGKMIAQGSHASIAFLTENIDQGIEFTEAEKAWISGNFAKICLYVNSEEELLAIHQAALDAGVRSCLILDEGLTEFNNVYTHTCLALGPDFSDRIDPITGHLPLL